MYPLCNTGRLSPVVQAGALLLDDDGPPVDD
jgi:hypothetical protein